MMDVRPIRTDGDYEWALKEIEPYFDVEPELNTPAADRFDVLATLIEAYEARHHPIPPAAPVDVIRFVMEQRRLGQSDLAKLLGSRSRASEILSGSRPLTLDMIDRLNQSWGIPADLLIRQPTLKVPTRNATLVAVFDAAPRAEAAVNDLIAAGVPSNSIEHYAQTTENTAGSRLDGATEGAGHQAFWAWLTGGSEVTLEHHALYDQSIRSGGTVVTVVADETQSDDVNDILARHGPIDLDDRHPEYSPTGAYGDVTTETADSGTTADNPRPSAALAPGSYGGTSAPPVTDVAGTATPGRTSEEVIVLSEETLQVGKRAVDRGTTRVRRYVVERSVEETIRLRDESVSVSRRPVSAGATVGTDAFTDREIAMTETDEEAVVAKSAHVVEEVVVQKGIEEHFETVRDTLRREEVEIDGPPHQALTPVSKRTGRTSDV